MPLTKEETSQQEYLILEEQGNELQEKIIGLKRKKRDLKREIKSLTAGINLLEKQKAEKSWKITCLDIITFGFFKYHRNKKINNQITIKQIAAEALRKDITKNTKTKYSLKNQKLKIATKLIKILKSLLSDSKEQVINIQTKFQQEISQKLDGILEQQRLNTIVHTESSSSLAQDSSGYNSDDEQQSPTNSRLVVRQNSKDDGLDDRLVQTTTVTYEELKFDDEIEVLSSSPSSDLLLTNELDENLVNNRLNYSLAQNNSDDEQCSNPSSQIPFRRNIKDSISGFQNGLSKIMEDDDGIEVIPEPVENKDNSPVVIIEKHNPLLRHDSKDSGIGSESEQLIFNQSLINSLDDILEKHYSVASYPVQ